MKATRYIERIALVGSQDFQADALDAFLLKLQEKYPGATIITGDGRGAERHVRDHAELLGFRLEVPELHQEWFGKAALDCQITDILKSADALVIAGSPTGSRPKVALDWHKRIFSKSDDPVPIHKIAAPEKKSTSTPQRRAKTKREALAS